MNEQHIYIDVKDLEIKPGLKTISPFILLNLHSN